MSKQTKSQWDFGELFPVEAIRKVLSVSELTAQVRRLLEKNIGQIWVTGEVTNFKAQSSGHFYFTLKDADSQLNCVLFRNEALETRALIQDGRRVVLRGDLTVYEPRGVYQLRVTAVELQGVGALQVAFEKLKQKLSAEGLFAQERKRPLPRFPQRIGIVTSPTGAAIRDILHVIERRNPSLEMVLVPCRVQGEGAAGEIAAGISLLNEFSKRQTSNVELRTSKAESKGTRNPQHALDLILVTRGGGSLEDLWAFNEEIVARAIFDSALPVVSAVGHEIDFTISDFVADLRAATPSAAAEIITEGVYSSCQFVGAVSERIRALVRQRLGDKGFDWTHLRQRLMRAHPRRRVNELSQRLDDLQESLWRCARQGTRAQKVSWRNLVERLARLRPRQVLELRRDLLQQTNRRLREQATRQFDLKRKHFTALEKHLRLLGPEQVLARGYSITMLADNGKVVRSADQVKPGQKLRTRLKSGEVKSKVEEG